MANQAWPALPLAEWDKTYATLHMWSQIVGKVRLALTPRINHWWNVPFYVTPRGLTTSTIHYGDRSFAIEFDFITHQLMIDCDDGVTASMALVPCPVAEFYRKFMTTLQELGIEVKIRTIPSEVENPVPFDRDFQNSSYDGEFSNRLLQILLQTEKVFTRFRSDFIGKCSPVHFFWGSFDLAVTRFSGRRAPEREGADPVTREAYSHEVVSHGFWPGKRASGAVEEEKASSGIGGPAFYAYAIPEPPGMDKARVFPQQAFYSAELKEWILPYDEVRTSASPEQMLLDFMQSTYEAAANLAGWDRSALERR
ncbi:DUF5996 family protein [Geobacter sp. SVR]|uniref:DUF5996 family protein n=1 Tax=Geobacter sp. SVR TaxID=2495594 RepID=UPI00143F04DA|nr:DUF5996 family protein [Geobacter sp. SVR]BCS52532.1 hypothetical protein GSVR_08400 [Geobacter sp. SVR]GCF84031.1 hypothetical protein GSbR_06310 [Geobacter sp. SVR]